jgi:HEAT repeat protein
MHGLLILDAGAEAPAHLPVATIPVKPQLSRQQQWLADVRTRSRNISSRVELLQAVSDENPIYRAEALASLYLLNPNYDDYLEVLATAAENPEMRLRATALYLIAKAKNDAKVIPLLRARLRDADPILRDFAALALLRHGVMPEPAIPRRMLARNGYDNYPFGAFSSQGVQTDAEQCCQALAALGTPEIFPLLLAHPLPGGYVKELGAVLRKHPEAAPVLLAAYDEHGQYGYGQVAFAQGVFKAAGAALLPALHAALASDDRVVRSNAARACGAIGDPSSIPPLIAALDMESGLARASIVWALGELKATAAMPALAKLYAEVNSDEHRRRGAGFRMAQAQAEIGAQYASLHNLEEIGSEWNELTASTLQGPRNPRRDEELLSAQHIRDAVRKIGAGAAQEFYRTLAGEKDNEARAEAAEVLAEGGPADKPKNLPILRSLLAESAPNIHIRAAVSLYLLGENSMQAVILAELSAPNDWQQLQAVYQLLRVRDASRLAFARLRLEALEKVHRNDYSWQQALPAVLKTAHGSGG